MPKKKQKKPKKDPDRKSRSVEDKFLMPRRNYVFFYPETGRMRVVSDYPGGATETIARTMAEYMDAELRIKS